MKGSALQQRLHKSFFKGEISPQVKPEQTNVKRIKLFKALNLFRVPKCQADTLDSEGKVKIERE